MNEFIQSMTYLLLFGDVHILGHGEVGNVLRFKSYLLAKSI